MSNEKRTIRSKKKNYASQFKLDRVLETLQSNGDISEVARKYDLSTSVLYLWRNQLIKHGSSIFETTPDKTVRKLKTNIARLEQMVGKKEVELSLLKNFSDFYSSQKAP